MEISVSEYGKLIFFATLGKKSIQRDHWDSIREEAEPLVRKLLALNNKLPNGGYKIFGYTNEDGKFVASKNDRIDDAIHQLWGVKAEDLKEGDRVWFTRGTRERIPLEDDSAIVEYIKDSPKGRLIVIDMGREGLYKIDDHDRLIKAPDDWDEFGESRYDKAYWLTKADELGL